MNIKDVIIMVGLFVLVLVLVFIASTYLVFIMNSPRVYQDTKHKLVNVYCHGVFTDDGELVNETADNFTVKALGYDNQYPKSVCKYTVKGVYYQ